MKRSRTDGRLFGHDRIERLGGAAERLVEAGEQLRAEAALERRARHGEQLADPLEAEPAGAAERPPRRGASAASGIGASASASPPDGQRQSGSSPKRASACAAPAVPATAMRAVKPSRVQKARMRSHIARSPPNRWATPPRSSQRPSGPESAARGVQRRAANRPRRLEPGGIALGIGVAHVEAGDEDARLGERHAGREAERARGGAGGGEDVLVAHLVGGDQGAFGPAQDEIVRRRLPRPARARPPMAAARPGRTCDRRARGRGGVQAARRCAASA